MFGLGIQELVIIFLIVMVLFGAKKLPKILVTILVSKSDQGKNH